MHERLKLMAGRFAVARKSGYGVALETPDVT
jgi:hypothetical protein